MKISVITAVYKSEATVGEAIASVTSQKYANLEHIIVEGKSPDGSLAVIDRMTHDRIRLISEPDEGIYDALNKGVLLSTGDVIGFLHSDDYFANENALTQIAAAFEDPEVEAVFSDLDYVAKADTDRIVRHWSTGPFTPQKLKYGWMPAHPTLYLRRDVYERIGAFETSFGIAADYDFIMRYFSQSKAKTVYIPKVLYKMRLGGISNRNLSKILQKMREDYMAIRRNKVGGLGTLILKNTSKLGQFVSRAQPRKNI